jgi:hypothetical protein
MIGLIREDRRVKVREIAEVTGIAKSAVHEIISDLNFLKMSARWVPKMLTEEHKSERMAASLENLCRRRIVESIVTVDETWVYECNPESKRNYIAESCCATLHITWKETLP